MVDNNLSKNRKLAKPSVADFIMIVGITIVGFSLLIFVPRVRSPWNIILMADITILVLLQVLLAKKTFDKREKFEKSNTILEWEEPRNAWHITEAHSFSLIMLVFWFVIGFVAFFSVFAIAMKLHPPVNPNKDTLTFSKLPAFSAGASAFVVILYASSWWWAHLKVKLTTSGVQRLFHNSPRTWKYDRIKSYSFETLRSKSNVYTLFILRNHKGKTWKIALNDSVDKAKLEEILNEHGIPKLEQAI